MNVCFMTKYHPNAASSRYRYYNYEKFLNDDIKVDFKPLLSEEYVDNFYNNKKNNKIDILKMYLNRILFILKNKKKYNLFIIEKELFPYFPYIIEKFLLCGLKYSIDLDDNAEIKYTTNILLKKIFVDKIRLLVENANLATVGNEWYLLKYKNAKNLRYLPTVIDYSKYKISENFNKDTFNIVWIGSRSTQKYLEKIITTLNVLTEEGYDITLKIIGSYGLNTEVYKFKYEIIKWEEDKEVEYICTSNVGIMPLENTEWEEGKCGFKLIQYMACGLPFIADKTIANINIARNSKNGVIIESETEWYNAIVQMYNMRKVNFNSREEQSLVVKKLYAYQVWGNKYSEYIKETRKV